MGYMWITGKRFLVITLQTWFAPKSFSRNSSWRNAKRDRISSTSNWNRTSFGRDDEQNKGTIPLSMFARRLSTMSSSIPVEIPQNPIIGQQRQQISELQFDKFPTPKSLLCWKIRLKNQATSCSVFFFFIGHYVMDQRSGDGRFIGRIKILTINCWKAIFNF